MKRDSEKEADALWASSERSAENCLSAQRSGTAISQICIRWLLQKQIVPLPKSTHEKYSTENADVFDFKLLAEDMANRRCSLLRRNAV